MERLEMLGNGVEIYVTDSHGFGTDAVLLAHFASPKKRDKVCDLGTGCGILPLLWCRGDTPAHIDAVELQSDAVRLAAQSIRHNRLDERVRVICADWRALCGILLTEHYDRVTCNPPYFALGTGSLSKESAACTARHEEENALNDVCATAARLLKCRGSFCLCHRPERLSDIFAALRSARLEPKRLCFVQQKAESNPWLVLCEAKKGSKSGLIVQPPLIIADNNGYTDTYLNIYNEYK